MEPSKPTTILIVEDERLIARDIQQALVGFGYDAFGIAVSAEEAIAKVAERRPDLVLMDIRIKGYRDGIETATILRERFGVPVVYLTAHADDATIQRAKQTEPLAYLMKPVTAAELRSTVEVSLHKHGVEMRLREREQWLSARLRAKEREQLVQAHRLAALETMASGVADALGNPLASITGNAEHVEAELERFQREIRRIVPGGDSPVDAFVGRLQELMNELLTSARRMAEIVSDIPSPATAVAGPDHEPPDPTVS